MSTFCYGYCPYVQSLPNDWCSCPSRQIYVLSNSSTSCQACPYDCYTCTNQGACSSCSATLDFRVLDPNSSRCIPIDGYFDHNATVCVKCPNECSTCSSLTVCSACLPRYYLNSSTSSCDSCPFDCFTCNSGGSCKACDSQGDHRQLDTSTLRCITLPGYY